jgi:large subunit ribosomal protein L32
LQRHAQRGAVVFYLVIKDAILAGFAAAAWLLRPLMGRPFAAEPDFQESLMAVQQNKKSPSKRGMHRSHNALGTPGTAIESTTGEVHLRHHISPTGFYRGRKVLKTKADA